MHTMTRAFYALGDSRTPTRVSLSMVALNFLLNCTLIWTPLGVAGLAWSTTICAWIQAVVLIRILGRRVGDLFDLHTRLATLKIMAATLVMTACTAVVSWGLPPSNSWSRWAMDLGLLTMVGIVGIFGTAIWWRMPEWRWALGRGDQELQAIDAGP
jgi:putative peptidoglycan lipid II flippase